MGQTDSEYIKVTTTFVPGHPPAKMTGSLFMWPGLFDQKNRSDGDLVQTVAEFHEPRIMQQTCDPYPGQWYAIFLDRQRIKSNRIRCIRPFVVHSSYISQTPPRGEAIDGTDKIKIDYTKAPGDNGLWNQTLWNTSKRYSPQLFTYIKGSARCKW